MKAETCIRATSWLAAQCGVVAMQNSVIFRPLISSGTMRVSIRNTDLLSARPCTGCRDVCATGTAGRLVHHLARHDQLGGVIMAAHRLTRPSGHVTMSNPCKNGFGCKVWLGWFQVPMTGHIACPALSTDSAVVGIVHWHELTAHPDRVLELRRSVLTTVSPIDN
jgi:hypothetical protein